MYRPCYTYINYICHVWLLITALDISCASTIMRPLFSPRPRCFSPGASKGRNNHSATDLDAGKESLRVSPAVIPICIHRGYSRITYWI